MEEQGDSEGEGAAGAEAAEDDAGGMEIVGFGVGDDPAEGINAVFVLRGVGVLGGEAVSYAYEDGACLSDCGRPAGIAGWRAYCIAPTMEVEDDGEGFVIGWTPWSTGT